MKPEVCVNPWIRLGIYKDEQYHCCVAEYPSAVHPGHISSEITSDDWNNEGLLWKLWNSSDVRNARRIMFQSGIASACKNGTNYCPGLPNIDSFVAKTDIQRNNIEFMKSSFHKGNTEVTHYPLFLELCLNYTCNMNCPYCHQKTSETANHYVPVKHFKNELVEFLRRALSVTLIGGETTICADYDLVIEAAKEAGGAKVDVVTNGHFMIQKILPNAELFGTIYISVDAASAETYAKVRPSRDEHYNWDRLVFNIQKMAQRKRNYIVMSFVISGYNYKEMSDMVLFAKKHKADRVYFTEVFDRPYVFKSKEEEDMITWQQKYPDTIKDSIHKALMQAKESNMTVEYQFPRLGMCGVSF